MGDIFVQQKRVRWHRQLKGLDKDDHLLYTNIAEQHTETEGTPVALILPIPNGGEINVRPPSGKCWYLTSYKAPHMWIGLKASNCTYPFWIDDSHQIPLLINYDNYIRLYNNSGDTQYFWINGIEYDNCSLLALVVHVGQLGHVNIQVPQNEYWYVGLGLQSDFMFWDINYYEKEIKLPWVNWTGIQYKWYINYPMYFHVYNGNASSRFILVWGYKWAV